MGYFIGGSRWFISSEKKVKLPMQGMKYINSEDEQELKKQLAYDRKQNLKEHLYIGYLIVGTLAFTLGIVISLKRLNGKN